MPGYEYYVSLGHSVIICRARILSAAELSLECLKRDDAQLSWYLTNKTLGISDAVKLKPRATPWPKPKAYEACDGEPAGVHAVRRSGITVFYGTGYVLPKIQAMYSQNGVVLV